jgi:hypothetical protein
VPPYGMWITFLKKNITGSGLSVLIIFCNTLNLPPGGKYQRLYNGSIAKVLTDIKAEIYDQIAEGDRGDAQNDLRY